MNEISKKFVKNPEENGGGYDWQRKNGDRYAVLWGRKQVKQNFKDNVKHSFTSPVQLGSGAAMLGGIATTAHGLRHSNPKAVLLGEGLSTAGTAVNIADQFHYANKNNKLLANKYGYNSKTNKRNPGTYPIGKSYEGNTMTEYSAWGIESSYGYVEKAAPSGLRAARQASKLAGLKAETRAIPVRNALGRARLRSIGGINAAQAKIGNAQMKAGIGASAVSRGIRNTATAANQGVRSAYGRTEAAAQRAAQTGIDAGTSVRNHIGNHKYAYGAGAGALGVGGAAYGGSYYGSRRNNG